MSGVFRIASFDILLGFFKAHVNPYEPTRNPFKAKTKACKRTRISFITNTMPIACLLQVFKPERLDRKEI